jgi:hypothetical protein
MQQKSSAAHRAKEEELARLTERYRHHLFTDDEERQEVRDRIRRSVRRLRNEIRS